MNYDVMGGAKRSAWPRTPTLYTTYVFDNTNGEASEEANNNTTWTKTT